MTRTVASMAAGVASNKAKKKMVGHGPHILLAPVVHLVNFCFVTHSMNGADAPRD